ncbi:MAG TPA: fibrobacter succinogenes major paralogous domain-containing protein [Chitinophagales bacterium]|nr:fibrobacter succinogenes major paralogous domain-containing protein [Chitinophagales bacterium]
MKNNLRRLFYAAPVVLLLLLAACEKEDTGNTPQTVTDADGNVYQTVKIGDQVWLKENLKVTHYNDGSAIPYIADATDWQNATGAAYCNFNNDSATAVTYGKLYNWAAVNSGKLCPAGWHVPSQAEWAQLETVLNSDGGSLKEAGTTHWLSPNEGATNGSGFTALPAGYRSYLGTFSALTYQGQWWSTTLGSDTAYYAKYYYVDFSFAGIYDNEDWRTAGHSVRCIKD